MAKCTNCGSIMFGGIRDGSRSFCNDNCRQRYLMKTVGGSISPSLVEAHVAAIHGGRCPLCGGPGPVDVHKSHYVWSAFIMTRFKSMQHVCCRSCATKKQLGDLAISLVMGWWGIPWGIIMTPVQVGRNIAAMACGPRRDVPSAELRQFVRTSLMQGALDSPPCSTSGSLV